MAGERIVPKALQDGDLIAFISPSTRLNRSFPTPQQRAKAFFEKQGYRVKVIFNDAVATNNIHEAILQRCEEVHEAFRDPDVKAVICTVGGTPSNELLPYLDYPLIKANPKIFVGYSDITMLHYAISHQTGLQTFYGPCALSEFGEAPEPFPFTVNHFFHVLRDSAGRSVGTLPRSPSWAEKYPSFFYGDEAADTSRELSTSPSWTWLRRGSAHGRIFGGCISVVVRLAGTKYWPDYKGKILFLECPGGDSARDPYPISRARAAIADLVNTGVFREISGLVIGRSFGYDEDMRRQFAQIIAGLLEGTTFPILMEVDIGHTAPQLTIPLNAMASLDSEKDEFSILEPGVIP
ncbi:hypothetical protein B7463_g8638, partial [Scytalidium lignicola]